MSTTPQAAFVKDSWQSPRNTRTFQALVALDNLQIAERIKELRAQRGSPPQRIPAAGIGVATRTYQTWEEGKSKPRYDHLTRLADYYGVSEDYILTGNESGTPEDPVVVSEGVEDVRAEFREHVKAMHAHMDRVQDEIRAVHNRLTRIESRLPLMESDADVLERYAGPERRAHARALYERDA